MNYLLNRGALTVASVCAVIVIGCQEQERDFTVNGGSEGTTGGTAGSVEIPGGSGGALGEIIPGTGGTAGDSDASTPGGAGGGVAADAAVDEPVVGGTDAPIVADAAPPDPAPKPDPPVIQPPAPLQECATPSVDRLQFWMIGSDDRVVTAPTQGNILVREGARHIGKVSFVGNGWHLVAVWVANAFSANVDLTNAGGFTLTYSSTAPFWVQMRSASRYDGGNHFLVALPSTGGQIQSRYVPLLPGQWTWLPRLGMPAIQFVDAIKDVRALAFIGDVPNQIVVQGLRFDSFVPNCR